MVTYRFLFRIVHAAIWCLLLCSPLIPYFIPSPRACTVHVESSASRGCYFQECRARDSRSTDHT